MDVIEVVIASTRKGGVVTVTVTGEVDIVSGPHLRTAGLAALDGTPSELVIDLSAVPFMDSSGLGHLTQVLRAARLAAVPVRMLVAHPEVIRLFRMTGLSTAFAVQQVS